MAEAFQLVTAALVYLGNAVRTMDVNELHHTSPPVVSLMLNQPTLLRLDGPPAAQAYMAKAHLASACVRLPASVVLCARRTRPHAPASTLRAYLVGDDFDRTQLLTALKQVPALGCCGTFPSLDVSLAIVVALRDAFAHGESGQGSHPWRLQRGALLDKAYICQISRAALEVAQSILRDLT